MKTSASIKSYINELLAKYVRVDQQIVLFKRYHLLIKNTLSEIEAVKQAIKKINGNQDLRADFYSFYKNAEISDDARLEFYATNASKELLTRIEQLLDFYLESVQNKSQNYGYMRRSLFDFISNIEQEYEGNKLQNIKNYVENLSYSLEDGAYGLDTNDFRFFSNVFLRQVEILKFTINIVNLLKRRIDQELKWVKYPEDEKFMPAEAEDIEIMYHASVNAKELYENGFQEGYRKPKAQGLGGSGHEEGYISFTWSLDYARTIARALKETIMIAKGEIGGNQIIDWYKSENMIDILKKFLQDNKKYTPNDPFWVFQLYNYYLWNTRLRENPLFINTSREFVEHMAEKDIKNVGILVAKIDMTQKDKVFKKMEHEYRVRPASIVSIDKLIQ